MPRTIRPWPTAVSVQQFINDTNVITVPIVALNKKIEEKIIIFSKKQLLNFGQVKQIEKNE